MTTLKQDGPKVRTSLKLDPNVLAAAKTEAHRLGWSRNRFIEQVLLKSIKTRGHKIETTRFLLR
jgi:hypothetical protein